MRQPRPAPSWAATLRPFFVGLCLRPLLLLPVLLVLSIAWLGLGQDYGIPDQLWHENPFKQALAGLGAALVLLGACFVAYLLDREACARAWHDATDQAPAGSAAPAVKACWQPRHPAAARGWPSRLMRFLLPAPRRTRAARMWKEMYWYLGRTWLPLLAVLALAAVFSVTKDWPARADGAGEGPRRFRTVYTSEGAGPFDAPGLVLGLTEDWCVVLTLPQRWPFLAGLLLCLLTLKGVHTARRWLLSWAAPRAPEKPAAPGAPKKKGPPVKKQLLLHLLIFAAFAALVWGFVPNSYHRLLCLLLAAWAGAHGLAMYGYRGGELNDPQRREAHALAGLAFGSFLFAYLVAFVVHWVWGPHRLAAYLAAPALVFFLLLAMAVLAHGFLAYHLGRWYVLLAAVAFAGVMLLNARTPYKLHFPEMSYKGGDLVEILEGDFEGAYEQLLRRHAELKEAPDDPPRRQAVERSYRRVVRSYNRLLRRLRDELVRQEQGEEFAGLKDPWASDAAVGPLLEQGRLDKAEEEYENLREYYALVSRWLARLEYDNLDRWRRQLASPVGAKPKLVVVTVSGGASRSALWTTFALDTLERELGGEGRPFAPHVRVISGASGGMVGAAYWVATLDGRQRRHVVGDWGAFEGKVARDSLTAVGQHTLFLDLPTVLLPGAFGADRGRALEEAWSTHLDGSLDAPVKSLAAGESQGWRPALVFSPMLVEDGRRLLISNRYLPFLTESAGASLSSDGLRRGAADRPDDAPGVRLRPTAKATYDPYADSSGLRPGPEGRQRYSLSGVEFFQLFDDADARFKLSTAARMSASFPYASPAVDLPTAPRRRVVDAGYYDNYGVNVAAAWLYQYRHWVRDNTSGVVMVQLRDSVSEDSRLFPDRQDPLWDLTRGFEWLTGPLTGARSAREAQMSFRNDEQAEALSKFFNQGGAEFFTTAVFASTQRIAMSWYLSRADVRLMRAGFQPSQKEGKHFDPENAKALRKLKAWWGRSHSPRR